MFDLRNLDLDKLDPDWAREHKLTLWAAGVGSGNIDRICKKPGFAAQRLAEAEAAEQKKAFEEILEKAKSAGAKEALAKLAVEKLAAEKQSLQKSAFARQYAAKDNTTTNSTAKGSTAKDNATEDSTNKDTAANVMSAPTKNARFEEKKGGALKQNVTFTAEDDDKIKELKQAGKSFKEMAKQLRKAPQAIENRFNEISPGDQQAGGSQKQKPKKSGRGRANESTATRKDKADDGENWDFQSVGDPAGPSGPSDGDYMIIYPDNVFTEEMCVAMGRAMYEDFNNYHMRIASRIFDHTGQRVSASAVKAKLSNARSTQRAPNGSGN